jgi:Astacin (Peptidase family M12A)
MYDEHMRMREALARIAELAEFTLKSGGDAGGHADDDEGGGHGPSSADIGCTLRALPKSLLVEAAQTAREINPANAPHFGPVIVAGMQFDISDPLRISVLTAKFWGPKPRKLSVSFMETASPELRRKILQHMNAWNQTVAIQFVETGGTGEVRISREGDGYWSYLGTDILLIKPGEPTMNLQGFTLSTVDSEYRRVVRHETGHTLGCPHEHMRRDLVGRVDPEKAYEFFLRTQGWDRAMVDAQVLKALDEKSLMGTPADQDSIMCYQLPGSITRDGKPIRGGTDINATDFAFMGRLYPLPHAHVQHQDTCSCRDTEYADAA